MDKYRIEQIEKATINGKKVKLFKAFRLDEKASAYVFVGQFAAPRRTANKDLEKFIQ